MADLGVASGSRDRVHVMQAKDFKVESTSNQSSQHWKHLQDSRKCKESPLLQQMYSLCSADRKVGPPQQLVTVKIDPWTGEVQQGAFFSIVSLSQEAGGLSR